MKIIVDAMGGDNAPLEIVRGAHLATEEFGIDVILVGIVEEILKCFEKMGIGELPSKIEVADAVEVVTMDDDPATVIKSKKNSSMAVGLRMLRDGQGDAMVSAGNTGALLSGSTLTVKRIKGIRRAAMAPILPNKGGGVVLVDCGATVECTKEYLLQFAHMGHFYAREVLGVDNPRVGLLNIGAEAGKGTELQRETYALLNEVKHVVNFIGNVEARDVMMGGVDVIVADGYTGNILLKSIEGTAQFVSGEMKKIFVKNAVSKLASRMVKSGIDDFKKLFDVSETGGTALLGISKPVIKAHGNSKAYALRSAIKQAMGFASSNIIGKIEDNMSTIKGEK